MDREFEKQLQDFYQCYRDRTNWPLCDGIRVDDLARDTVKFLKNFKSVQFTNTEVEPKSSIGKFTSSDELYKLYINLEREYTKSSQELAERGKEIEKLGVMLDTSLTKLHKARRRINKVLLKIAKVEAELDNYTIQNETFLKRDNQHE